jgi:nucleotide-binding universal stress UspA family protein/hemerythrin-like domain-containing protein
MYRHLLVPLDETPLATYVIGKAVEFARHMGARITFFSAAPDYGATEEGALNRTIAPDIFASESTGEVRAILAKAEASARVAQVSCDSLGRISDRPYEAILDVAAEHGCDLIFMASHGRRGIRGLIVGSQVQKVLAQTKLPVLVCTVERNAPALAMETSIAIIEDEHRALAVVIHGLRYVLQEACYKGTAPDFALLRSIQHYLRKFPEALHHPKEDAYLFRKLRLRTDATDEIIRELQRQHAESGQRLNELGSAIDLYETGAFGALPGFAQAVERFAESQWQHMSLEEKVILPAAQKHLTDEDWAEIALAFGKNGDPRFGAEPNAEFGRLFKRILDLAPPNAVGGEGRPAAAVQT